jgi:sugar phosphate permease
MNAASLRPAAVGGLRPASGARATTMIAAASLRPVGLRPPPPRRPAAAAPARRRRPLAAAPSRFSKDEQPPGAKPPQQPPQEGAQEAPVPAPAAAAAAAAAGTSPTAATAAAAADAAPAPYPPGFEARRWILFAGLVVGYLSLYLSRLTLTYAAPVMCADPALGLTKTQIGLLASAFPAAYGVSKFASGMLGAAFSPRLMLAGAALVTGGINLAFGASSGVGVWTALWALNGALQGAGAPACAMLLSRWYAPSNRGTFWGLWNCLGSNFGGFAAPLLVGAIAAAAGWRMGFFVPGAWGVLVGVALLWALADDPTRLGFPPADPAEAARAKAAAEREEREHGADVAAARAEARRAREEASARRRAAAAASGTSAAAAAASLSSTDTDEEEDEDEAAAAAAKEGGEETPEARARRAKRAALARSMAEVCRNRGIWLLATAYFCVYVVRQGATSWLVFWMIECGHVPNAAQAAASVSGLELGGLLGGTLAGWFSDRAIRAAKADAEQRAAAGGGGGGGGEEEAGLVGKRVQVTMAYAAATLLVLAALRALPAAGCPPALLWLTIAALGFCIYGPQMLIGLCGAELVAPASVGASQGVLGLISYAGAANAGAPLALVVGSYGWDAYFATMAAASVAAVALLAPLANARSRAQEDQREAATAAAAAAAIGGGGPNKAA